MTKALAIPSTCLIVCFVSLLCSMVQVRFQAYQHRPIRLSPSLAPQVRTFFVFCLGISKAGNLVGLVRAALIKEEYTTKQTLPLLSVSPSSAHARNRPASTPKFGPRKLFSLEFGSIFTAYVLFSPPLFFCWCACLHTTPR